MLFGAVQPTLLGPMKMVTVGFPSFVIQDSLLLVSSHMAALATLQGQSQGGPLPPVQSLDLHWWRDLRKMLELRWMGMRKCQEPKQEDSALSHLLAYVVLVTYWVVGCIFHVEFVWLKCTQQAGLSLSLRGILMRRNHGPRRQAASTLAGSF